jgi:GNAT superfamily N-acetyltransferase
VDVLRRSITALCAADHRNDPAEIAAWVANKTEDSWRLWCANRKARVLVAVASGNILGVGMMSEGGEVLLNYVAPEARFQGVSRALMQAMEAEAVQIGLPATRLHSTRTAEAFYLSRGYRPVDGDDPRLMYKPLKPGTLSPR